MSSEMMYQPVNGEAAKGNAKYNNVLLVDDNSLDNFVNQKLLESHGFATSVKAVQSGQEAIDYLLATSFDQLPEVIFLDIIMPGMNGFEFLNAFENLPEMIQQQCKIVMLSTSESFRDLNRANKNRFVKKFLNKPLTEQTIQAINV